ncbi:PTS sugar transporter subunit IIB [Streptococcus sp. zg-86]|uniref:PTS sugar transporter subunit IIB n=1 Tax=Streptococcus zhangguiae TaxID=2664091 RepID=A0A6I4RK18_9STRE|nr:MULTISPECIES: PTS sugar transporter subunit IIB [unclassified Streptococcus]MTB64844.1 PTS sugar transporter subunit IIB [Streptococcus sp. zg-86]MTB91086.1 PTS sugar transporter subunit IIB [Streptococcus sp. zg-36]MWV56831.1 PTS sugar transporter subunit IIB [Streptococcus sp. zg-70]QTH48363.1 PTS sugar transporter subunit IIB [Streptococcus sp. zg-86]
MKNIMLVCNAGMSTSMLVTKMLKSAADKGIETTIWAVPVSEVADEVANKSIDVLLVGPQVKFMLDEYKENYEPAIKVGDINMVDYGTMNGDKVLDFALALLGD